MNAIGTKLHPLASTCTRSLLLLSTGLMLASCGLVDMFAEEDLAPASTSSSGGGSSTSSSGGFDPAGVLAGPDTANWSPLKEYTALDKLPNAYYKPEVTFASIVQNQSASSTAFTNDDGTGRLDIASNGSSASLGQGGANLVHRGNQTKNVGSDTFLGNAYLTNVDGLAGENLFLGLGSQQQNQFVRLGVWDEDVTNALPTQTLTYATLGQKTTDADMQTGGTATFTGKSIGMYVPQNAAVNASSEFAGDVTLTANFGNDELVGTINSFESTTGSLPFSEIKLNGTISGAEFSGTAEVVGVNNFETGTHKGAFYGPGNEHQEVGGSYAISKSISGYTGEGIVGSFVADQ